MTSPVIVSEGSGIPASPRALRLWPAWVLVALMVAARFAPAWLEGGLSNYWMIALFGPLLCCLLMVIWWLAASRATGKERLIGLAGLIGALAITLALVNPTMRGPGTTYLTLPMGMIAFALGITLVARWRPIWRTAAAVLVAFAGFASSLLLRTEGMNGNYVFDFRWRWSATPEEAMLAARPVSSPAASLRPPAAGLGQAFAHPEWPAFRGNDRAACARGPQLATNWSVQPPRLLWKVPVGPAWSSFAVAGPFLFTQEQRGPMEAVVCYEAATGREVWRRELETRFDEPLGGPGPRATPTLADGGLFATGATGRLLRLNPETGAVVWQQDLKAVAGGEVPMWGYAASPLQVGSLVVVFAGGPGDKAVLAFEAASGMLRWSAAAGNHAYTSPQLNTIAGEELVLMLANDGLRCLDPATGRERLNYPWECLGYRALQPRVVSDSIILLPTGMNSGTRAIRVTRTDGQLAAEELWTSRNLKPDFTDIVTHQGYAYGIDGGIFTCVDLKSGGRQWKDGRYGKGQVLLLESSNLLLVAAENGQVVLLRADPSQHVEVASFKALEGKTWNHPVVVGDRLYVRNSQQAAGFVLPVRDFP